jgi:uncharacterized membrane protein
MEQNLAAKKRIDSIDIVRGIAMVIMALDHVRDYFHIGANVDDPLNLSTTTPALYFTRWITHFCAPIFVFLSGTSIYLQSLRKTKKELGIFLLKRGLWLIIAECIIVGFGWTFNPFFNVIAFQVIWAIGISMFLLGIMMLVRLPYKVILVLGILVVAGHNLLDIPESRPGFKASFWWDLFHHGFFVPYQYAPKYYLLMVYPFVAWTGLMMLGYCTGLLFTPRFSPEQRKKILLYTGSGLIFFFVLLRYSNVYGDPFDWSRQQDSLHSFLSFLKVHKYPPSLLYLCITIGPALILLALIEKVKNRFTGWMQIYGRTAFFYYILHIYLIHIIATVCYFARGGTMSEAISSAQQLPFLFIIPGQGYNLWIVYGVWIAVVIVLYPLCKRYDRYKTLHKEKWWLSYL